MKSLTRASRIYPLTGSQLNWTISTNKYIMNKKSKRRKKEDYPDILL